MWAPRLYLVTDRTRTKGRDLIEVVDAALRGGVDAVQLREKDLSARELVELGLRLRQVCTRRGAKLLVNDRVDVALAVGADGVHLPAASFSPADARQLLGPNSIIGVSTHFKEEVEHAAANGVDFAVFGPIFDTESKRPYGMPHGIENLHDVCTSARVPVVAIGGIMLDNIAAVAKAGTSGVAVIGAILEAPEPAQASRELRRLCNRSHAWRQVIIDG